MPFTNSRQDWQLSLLPLKFLDENNRGVAAEAVLAVNYATMMKRDHGANLRVTNHSWGELGEFNAALRDAIAASAAEDILFVTAAGNGDVYGDGIVLDGKHSPFYPASYGLENMIRVLHAIGGSTNAVIHILALAQELDLSGGITLETLERLSTEVHCIVDVRPGGTYTMADFDEAGGNTVLIAQHRLRLFYPRCLQHFEN